MILFEVGYLFDSYESYFNDAEINEIPSYSLKEFLPHHYMRVNKIEKKIFQEHKKLQGTSEVDTKVKYVKLARSLPTFGVHFFLVKVSFILYIIIKFSTSFFQIL